MLVTRKYFKQYWWSKLAAVLVFTFICCGLLTQSAYASANGQEAVKQDPASNNAVSQDSQISDKEQKKVLPPTLTLTLQDEDGQPLVGVDLSAVEANVSGKERDSAQTDQNGKAVFKHLQSGTYYFFANLKAIRSHVGYDFPLIVKEIKSTRSYYISETKKFDLSANVECTYTIKRNACIWFETFLNVFKSDKIVVANKKMGIGQNIPVEADFIKIYMPMHSLYQIITVKDGDFDSWIIDFYAHENLRIELL